MPMHVLDSRRLRGPSLGTRVPAAVAEVAFDSSVERGDDRASFETRWRRCLLRAAAAVKRPELARDAHVRPFAGGLALLVPAPIDVLLAVADLNEWAIEAAEKERSGKRVVLSREVTRRLSRNFVEQARPALVALETAARARGAPFLSDDDEVILGLGKHARRFAMHALPRPSEIDWDAAGRIPVAFVTGTNGKTTTTRLVARMAKCAGLVPGNSSTDGVTIDERIEETGDWTGAEAARRVLSDPRVEVAILETARGGILRRGLAIDGVDAALITNVAADHLGEYGVHDVDTMAETKAVVGHAVRPGGYVILPADDAHLDRFIDGFVAETVLFARDPAHPRITSHLAAGKHVFVISEGRVVHRSRSTEDVLVSIDEPPITFGGHAPHNVKNVLAACALGWAMGISREGILGGLSSFGRASGDNPGRGELVTVPSGTRLLLDFGHNPPAIRDLLALGRRLAPAPAQIVLTTTLAGDRSDEAFLAYARAIREAGADRVIVWEKESLYRGRRAKETQALLTASLRSAGFAPSSLSETEDEPSAIRAALAAAAPLDLVVATPNLARLPLEELLRGSS